MSKRTIVIASSGFAVLAILTIIIMIVSSGYTQKYIMKKVYPIKYKEYVDEMSEKYNVEKPLIYAVIKAESNFTPDAESKAGAKGLMQIMPKTFLWLQKYTDDEYMDESYLNDPRINIDYGTRLLSILLKKYALDRVAICAYNAGMGIVDRWLETEEYSYDGESLSYIPYPETRFYVYEVIANRKAYKNLYFS